MGWSGLVTDPELYKLVDTVPWVNPTDPGLIATYGVNDTPAEMKMKLAAFTREKNMFTSFENISSAMVHLLMANIKEKFQISNISGLQGWHNDMTVMEILTQLQSKYGAPDPDAVAAMEAMFSKPHNPNDSLEVLYATLEECQNIAMMNKNPLTEKQAIYKRLIDKGEWYTDCRRRQWMICDDVNSMQKLSSKLWGLDSSNRYP
jgi:hypothetical protein